MSSDPATRRLARYRVGRVLAGLLRADLGSYLEAFIPSGMLCFIAALMVMFIGVDWRR